MASASVQNPPAPTQSKSSKKKKAKAEQPARGPAPITETATTPAQDATSDESSESAHVRELAKTIRNVNKKIFNASKTDGVIAENKNKTLEELVSLKIINADQKAQHLKKPELLKQLASLEEQIAQYKKIDHEYRTRAVTEKAEYERGLTEKHEKELATAVAEVKDNAQQESKKQLYDALLLVSQFLRLAAARRQEDTEQDLEENRAMEGVLLRVYSGDEAAVGAMLSLLEGSSEETLDTNGETVKVTYAQIKDIAIASFPQGSTEDSSAPAETEISNEIGSDPTLAHATLTEIDQGTDAPFVNGDSIHPDDSVSHVADNVVPENAGNAAAEAQWDANKSNGLETSQEWVEVPRDPAETETGLQATPAAAGNTQSWADEAPEPAAAASTDPNDGFSQVPARNRGRGNHEGGHRGRGGNRGRGAFRGDGRGRGRGRGGPFRGAPRPQAEAWTFPASRFSGSETRYYDSWWCTCPARLAPHLRPSDRYTRRIPMASSPFWQWNWPPIASRSVSASSSSSEISLRSVGQSTTLQPHMYY